VYFGKPGAMVTLPYPRNGIDKPYDRVAFDFISGAGNHRVSQLIGGSRAYTLEWRNLHLDNYDLLSQFWTGMMGTGPWALLDPSMGNLLTAAQSSATSLWKNATGWATTSVLPGYGFVSSNETATFIHRAGAPRSIRWYFPNTPEPAPAMGPVSPWSGWYGFPVVPGAAYSWSAWVRPDGVIMVSPTLAAKIKWLDATGTLIGSEISGGSSSLTTWKRYSVTGTAPAGAAYCVPTLVGSSFVIAGSLYIDEPLLEQDTVVNNWAPGTGLRPVEITNLTDQVPFNARWRASIELGLREVG
jgi:hypothetical protein